MPGHTDESDVCLVRLSKSGRSHVVTVPKALLAGLGWRRGTVLNLTIGLDGVLTVRAVKGLIGAQPSLPTAED